MAIKRTRYAVRCDEMTTAERLASEVKSGVIVYDTSEELFYKYNGNGWSAINNSNDVGTGWAQYQDKQYTSGSPLVVTQGNTVTIDNNAAEIIDSNLPTGVTSFYDNVSSRITPENVGDAYILRVDFIGYTSSPSGLASLKIDIGDGITPNVILERAFVFPKGTGSGSAENFSYTTSIYSLNTFVANGGLIELESITGTTTIYNINYVITRVHKA